MSNLTITVWLKYLKLLLFTPLYCTLFTKIIVYIKISESILPQDTWPFYLKVGVRCRKNIHLQKQNFRAKIFIISLK